MSTAKAKTINLLLYDGNLEGVICIEDSSWNAGELYSTPRESVEELLKTDAVKKYGVYLLLSKDKVYVGQSSDLSKRITYHTVGKDWWETVVILTTSDNRLNHSDIDYLEAKLIDKAQKLNSLDCDNKTKGNDHKISKFQKVSLDQYLDEALFLMELIGVSVFSNKKATHTSKGHLIETIDTKTRLAIGKRAKNEAIQYLESQGVILGDNISYAVRQEGKDEFWINPKVDLLGEDWYIILNDTTERQLIILTIPKNSLSTQSKGNSAGLLTRTDKPELLDLNINANILIDRKSNVHFMQFIKEKVKY